MTRAIRNGDTRDVSLPGEIDAGAPSSGSSGDGSSGLHQARDLSAVSEGRLRILVDGVPQLLWRSTDMGHWTWSNAQWQAFTGQSQEQSQDRGWLDAVHPDDRAHTMAAWSEARPHGQLDVEFRVRRAADGAFLWHRTRSNPVYDADGHITEWLGSTTDVEELKALQLRQRQLIGEQQRHAQALEREIGRREALEARLLHDAQHDVLTGLSNRAHLMDRLRLALDQALSCVVLLLDLDRFKLVNDSLGHQTGDHLLKEVGHRLQNCIRPIDTLARFGGDEFVMLIQGQPATGATVAERVAAVVHQPLWLGEQEVFPSCSIGVVQSIEGYGSVEAILRDADIAMYNAKRSSQGNCAVFDAAMHTQAVEALSLRTDLRNALARGELHVHYQPICAIDTGRIVAVEALLRWQHEKRGDVSPAVFIAVAEEIGVIAEIGRWVLREACLQARTWYERFPELGLRVSVNTSGQELARPDFVAGVRRVLDEAGLDPRLLQLEVTESIFLSQPGQVGSILNAIRALGVRIALDDFGTGYSSLGYLDRYRVDTVKIDRSFVAGLPERPRTLAIVAMVLGLGDALGLDVVVEGVEEPDELRALQEAGGRFVQGYITGRPAPAYGITPSLERQVAQDSRQLS